MSSRLVLVPLLLAVTACSASRVQTRVPETSPYAPAETAVDGQISYLSAGAKALRNARREDAYRKMYEHCDGNYEIIHEEDQRGALGPQRMIWFRCLDHDESEGQDESIVIPFLFEDDDSAWEVGYSAENELQRVVEFVRPGQTVENWSEMVTVQTFNKAVGLGSVENQLSMFRTDLLGRCPDSKVDVIQQGPKGILYEARVGGCEQGPEEHVFARLLDGSHNRFLVQYSVREPATILPERREKWLEKLTSVEIVNSR